MALVGAKEIAEFLGLSRVYVVGVVMKRPGFPKPRVNTSVKNRRWDSSEVAIWARSPGKNPKHS